MKKLMLILMALVLMLSASALAEEPKVTLKIGFSTNAEDPRGLAAVMFKEQVEADSNGALTVEIYPAGQLGGDAALIEAMTLDSGEVDIIITDASNFATYEPKKAVATGIALGCKIQKQDNYTYAIIGDGEMQEGLVWEAAINAASHQLGRLIVFSDCNNYQSGGHVTDMTSLYPVSDKWQAFHWHVQHVNGHDIPALLAAVQAAKNVPDRPSLIECQTVKGKGISFMENNNAWHKRVPTQDEMMRPCSPAVL